MDHIEFALAQLNQVLGTVMTRQAMLTTDRNGSALVQDYGDAAAYGNMINGLRMAETILRDQIRGLKVAQGVTA